MQQSGCTDMPTRQEKEEAVERCAHRTAQTLATAGHARVPVLFRPLGSGVPRSVPGTPAGQIDSLLQGGGGGGGGERGGAKGEGKFPLEEEDDACNRALARVCRRRRFDAAELARSSIQRKVLLAAAGLAVLSLVVTFLGLHPGVPRVLAAGAGAFAPAFFLNAGRVHACQNQCASCLGMGAGCS